MGLGLLRDQPGLFFVSFLAGVECRDEKCSHECTLNIGMTTFSNTAPQEAKMAVAEIGVDGNVEVSTPTLEQITEAQVSGKQFPTAPDDHNFPLQSF